MKKLAILIMLLIIVMSESVSAEKRIVINLAARTLTLYDGNVRVGVYGVGVGKRSTVTPTGYYKILTKEINPTWIDPTDPEYEIPSGADNPLGYRWMQIQGNYGIHGTNKPESIGHYVSNGCIRMKEADVEAVYEQVEVGTPVDITYNRIVVEKATDERIAYYIYPDGYGWQNVNVSDVEKWLAPYGVGAFVTQEEISKEIEESRGEAVYIGKAYGVEINGKEVEATEQNGRHFDSKAVVIEGITYLPAVPIAMALEQRLEWRNRTTLATKYGEASGIERKGQLYFNADDTETLFHKEGSIVSKESGRKVYELRESVPEVFVPKEEEKEEPKGNGIEQMSEGENEEIEKEKKETEEAEEKPKKEKKESKGEEI